MYGICERIAEISPRLHVWLLTKDDDPRFTYLITEHCEDGVERKVFKVKELDGRVEQKLRKLYGVPLSVRLQLIEKENDEFERQAREDELDDLYERMGRPMWTELEKTGFIKRGVSYPTVTVATRGRRLR